MSNTTTTAAVTLKMQSVLEDKTITAEEKIKRLQVLAGGATVTVAVPVYWDPNERLEKLNTEKNIWNASVYVDEDERLSYEFIPQADGSRLLEGEYSEWYPNSYQSSYHAYYVNGIISTSTAYYPSGNTKEVCVYGDNGMLDAEHHYPDVKDSGMSKQMITCNSSNSSFIKHFDYHDGKQCLTLFTNLERGFKHGEHIEYYKPSECSGGDNIKVTGNYHNGKMHGKWRGFYPNAQPRFYQDWVHGLLNYELTWNREGHLTEKIFPDRDYYYNDEGAITEERILQINGNWSVTRYNGSVPKKSSAEITPEGTVVEHQMSGHPDPEYASKKLNSLNQKACRERKWDDNFNRNLNYGFRTILIDEGVPYAAVMELLVHAKEYFAGYTVRVEQAAFGGFAVFVIVPELVAGEK